jgi:ferredoxin
LVKLIEKFVAGSSHNSLGMEQDEPAFDAPLVGFSNGSDALYKEYQNHIGSFYLLPADFFASSFPGVKHQPNDLVIISWIIPSTKKTREEQAGQDKHPEGPYAPCSNWSERHAAYAAGLGTFGLCDGLITPVGKAVRVGSVIAKCSVEPTPRPYTDHHAYCLHFSHDTCRECIGRCPVNALSEHGHDKKKCMQYTERAMNIYIKKKYGLDTYACGLCQAGVACTYGIPDADDYQG